MRKIEPGSTVAVFGGSGFLGSHVADALSDAGYFVRIFDRTPSPYLRDDQQMIVGDLMDGAALADCLEGCSAVYNFAGIADIGHASRDPRKTAEINVLGNVRLLEAARCAGVLRYVFASTVYVYSRHGSFYRASKQAAERFIETYAENDGLPFTILRYGTLYGRRANSLNRIHTMIHQALNDGRIDYPGSGNALREFIHVTDAAALSVQILEPAYRNRHLLVTGQEKMCVRDVLRMIQEMLPQPIEIRFQDGEPEGHYELTPYAFNPTLGHKLVPSDFVDFGQGLLDCIAEQCSGPDVSSQMAFDVPGSPDTDGRSGGGS
jgi:UDP-glucose 4-epimerase